MGARRDIVRCSRASRPALTSGLDHLLGSAGGWVHRAGPRLPLGLIALGVARADITSAERMAQSDAVTMPRLRRPRSRTTIVAGTIRSGPTAPSYDLRIGVAFSSSRLSDAAVRPRTYRGCWSARANDCCRQLCFARRPRRRSSAGVDRSFANETATSSCGPKPTARSTHLFHASRVTHGSMEQLT